MNWTSGTTSSSSTPTRSSGAGCAKPIASRMTSSSSTGTPDSTLSWANVVSPSGSKRSYVGESAKSRPKMLRRIPSAIPASGRPERSSERTIRTRRTWPVEKRPSGSGAITPRSRSSAIWSGSHCARTASSSRVYSPMALAWPLAGGPVKIGQGSGPRPRRDPRPLRSRPTSGSATEALSPTPSGRAAPTSTRCRRSSSPAR